MRHCLVMSLPTLEQRGSQADISNPYRKLVYQGGLGQKYTRVRHLSCRQWHGCGQFPLSKSACLLSEEATS